LPRAQTDERYNFGDGNKVRHIPADRSGSSCGLALSVRGDPLQ
jgi:hypothetical protein